MVLKEGGSARPRAEPKWNTVRLGFFSYFTLGYFSSKGECVEPNFSASQTSLDR